MEYSFFCWFLEGWHGLCNFKEFTSQAKLFLVEKYKEIEEGTQCEQKDFS